MKLQHYTYFPVLRENIRGVLVLLHGYGSNANDLLSFAPEFSQHYAVLSLQAPHGTPYGGFAWYDINWNNADELIDVKQANDSLNTVLEDILTFVNAEKLADMPVHLIGFSQGGVLAYALALQVPGLFHRVACLSTYPEEKILTRVTTDKAEKERLRFFISHGTEDAVIPLEWGRKAADLLYDKGFYFTFREYMAGHQVNQKNFLDLAEFFKN